MIRWEPQTEELFRKLLLKIPVFLRNVAEVKVAKCAEAIVIKDGRNEITEKDLVDAFFKETPFGFHGPLKNDMQELGVDYVGYGYDK